MGVKVAGSGHWQIAERRWQEMAGGIAPLKMAGGISMGVKVAGDGRRQEALPR